MHLEMQNYRVANGNAVCKIIAGIEIWFLVLKKCLTSSKFSLYLQFICKMGMNNNFISYYKNYRRLKLAHKTIRINIWHLVNG